MSQDWNAYHFVNETLRDESPIPENGVTLKFDGEIELCRSGYHFSRKPWQALMYAPGHTLCRVHVGGQIIEPRGEDKGVCTERTIVSRVNAETLLFDFARSCARDVLHLWDAPDIVKEFLETGNEDLRDAARAAARPAAWDAAWPAAWDAAWDAARAAARAAAWAAAWDAARAAARAAAWAAAWDAARAAAQKKQRARFTRMINAAFEAAK